MRKYEKPELEVVNFWNLDVLTVSEGGASGPFDPDNNTDLGGGEL